MEKPVFYCDCDGVILNTIEIAFDIMRDNGLNINDRRQTDLFFKSLINWNEVFSRAKVINGAIEKLRYIKDSGAFKDVIILTKLSGGYHEEGLKRALFNKTLPNIKVITLQYGLNKGLVVKAKGNILVDDEIGNCEKWQDEEGIPILFSPYVCNPENDIISDLEDLSKANGVKKLLKTR